MLESACVSCGVSAGSAGHTLGREGPASTPPESMPQSPQSPPSLGARPKVAHASREATEPRPASSCLPCVSERAAEMRCSRAVWAASSEWRSHAGAGTSDPGNIHGGGVQVGDVRHTCSEGSGSSTPGGAPMASLSSCQGRFAADASRCRCSWITPASANGEAVGTSVPLEMMKRTYAVVADDSAK